MAKKSILAPWLRKTVKTISEPAKVFGLSPMKSRTPSAYDASTGPVAPVPVNLGVTPAGEPLGAPANAPTPTFELGPLSRPQQPVETYSEFANPKSDRKQWLVDEAVKNASPTAEAQKKFEYRKISDLQPYKYELSRSQIDSLKDLYANREGYRNPDKVDPDSAVSKVQKTQVEEAELTWDAYDALTPDQRKAVDFTGMLVEAREKDLELPLPSPITAEKREEYDAKVADMFGEDGGSKTFAPHVVDLLSQIDFKAVGADLDEFLSLERGFSPKDLKNFSIVDKEIVQGVAAPDETQMLRANNPYMPKDETATGFKYSNFEELQSPENQLAIQSALAGNFGDVLEDKMKSAGLWDVRSTWQQINPGSLDKKELRDVPLGWGYGVRDAGDAEQGMTWDKWYNNLAQSLKDKEQDIDWVWEDMKNYAFTDKDKQYFYQWVDNLTRMQLDYGFNTDAQTRDPNEMRKLVGLDVIRRPDDGEK